MGSCATVEIYRSISNPNVEKTNGKITGGGAPEEAGPVEVASIPIFEDILVLVVVDENTSLAVNTNSRAQIPSSPTQTALPDISTTTTSKLRQFNLSYCI